MKHTRASGQTLIEILVATGLFTILLAALFFLYNFGAASWMKGNTKSELLGEIQKFQARFTRAVELTSFVSLTIDTGVPDAVCFLSPLNDDGDFQFNPYLNRPRWQKYLFFYRDTTSGEVFQAEQSVLGTEAELAAKKIGNTVSDRLLDLSLYKTGGRAVLRNSKSLTFRIMPLNWADRSNGNEALEMHLVVERPVKGSTVPQELESRSIVKFRN